MGHIEKEDSILFRLGDEILDDDDKDFMIERFKQADVDSGGRTLKEFEKIAGDFKQQESDLGKKREEEFARAVAQTEAILDEQQRTKYEQIIKNRMGHLPTTGQGDSMSPIPLPTIR